MVLPLSGQISLLSLQDEFGGSNPIGIDEYYSSGGAPGSGQIGINTFYGRFANWTTYMMGNGNLFDVYSGNIVVPGFQVNEHFVWGATAMMLSELKETLKLVL